MDSPPGSSNAGMDVVLAAASVNISENKVLSSLFPAEFGPTEEEPAVTDLAEPPSDPEQDINAFVDPETEVELHGASRYEGMNDRPTWPSGNRDYLDSKVIPLLKEGLVALLEELERVRMAEASGEAWLQEDGFLPPEWAPFSPLRWLANWLEERRPTPTVPSYGALSRLERASLAFSALEEAEDSSLVSTSVFHNKLSIDRDLVESALSSLGLSLTGDLNSESFSQVLVDASSATSQDEAHTLVILDIAVLRATGPFALLNRCTEPADQIRITFLLLLQTHLDLTVLSSSSSIALPSDLFQSLLSRIAPHASFAHTSLSSLTVADFEAEVTRLWAELSEVFMGDQDESNEDKEPVGVQLALSAIEQLHGLPANQSQDQSSPFDEVEPTELSDLVRQIHGSSSNVRLVAASQVLDSLAAQRIAGGDNIPFLLVDVRTREEYQVSCIPGSIHLEAREEDGWKLVDREAAQTLLADAYAVATTASEAPQRSASSMNASIKRRQPHNRLPTVITYCDVGHRSFGLVDEIGQVLAEALGPSNASVVVSSLCGGILNFYNAGGRVVKGGGEGEVVNAVHPGSDENRKYITRRNAHSH